MKITLKTLMKRLDNTANTKEGTYGPNWRRLTRIAIEVFWKTVRLKSFQRCCCKFKYNARDTQLFVTKQWFSHLQVISSLTLNSITSHASNWKNLNKLDWAGVTQPLYLGREPNVKTSVSIQRVYRPNDLSTESNTRAVSYNTWFRQQNVLSWH